MSELRLPSDICDMMRRFQENEANRAFSERAARLAFRVSTFPIALTWRALRHPTQPVRTQRALLHNILASKVFGSRAWPHATMKPCSLQHRTDVKLLLVALHRPTEP